ncbi:MAG: ABC transporter substrate-binding protein [Bacillota bacterium]
MKKITALLMLLFLLLLSFATGCSTDRDVNQKSAESKTGEANTLTEEVPGVRTITDMVGRKVEVPATINKIIGLGAGGLRFICYLNETEKVVGVEEAELSKPVRRPYQLAFLELTELPSIGPAPHGDAELIAAHRPDVVLYLLPSDSDDLKPMEDLQNKTGIPVVMIRPSLTLYPSIDKFHESLRFVGKLLGNQDRAEELIKYTEDVIADLKQRTKDIPEDKIKKVYVGGKGMRGAQGILSTSPTYSAFEFINAKNVAAELGTEHAFIDKEALLQWDPEFIFIESFGFDLVLEDLKKPEYSTLTALKNNNLFRVFPKAQYGVNFETELVVSYFVGKMLYPERFEDVDPVQKADEIYSTFLNKPLYNELVKVWGGFEKVEIK